MKKSNYTLDIFESMISGMIQNKESKGFRRLNNGLYEDCLGQVFTVDLEQYTEVTGTTTEEAGVISHIVLKLKPVNVMGHL